MAYIIGNAFKNSDAVIHMTEHYCRFTQSGDIKRRHPDYEIEADDSPEKKARKALNVVILRLKPHVSAWGTDCTADAVEFLDRKVASARRYIPA